MRSLKLFKFLLLTGLLFLISVSGFSQKFFNCDSAFYHARQSDRPLLMVFSGSDWCPGCIRFEKKVLKNTAFIKYSRDKLVILIVDFPQKKKPNKLLVMQNEKLAEQYNAQSTFPKLILLSPATGSKVELLYINQDAGEFIAQVEINIPKLKE